MDTSVLIGLTAAIASVLGAIAASIQSRNSKLKVEIERVRSKNEELTTLIQEAIKIQHEVTRAGLSAGTDNHHHLRFKPVEASIRQSFNILGEMMKEIGAVYPQSSNDILLSQIHARAAERFLHEAKELENAPFDLEKEVPMTCGFIGSYPNMLKMLTENLLQPIASLRETKASEEKVKEAALRGLRTIAKSLEYDAEQFGHYLLNRTKSN